MYYNNKYDKYYYCDFLKSYGPNNVLAYLLLYYICMHILSICSYHHIHHREGKIGKITSRRVIICIILHIYMDYFILDINILSMIQFLSLLALVYSPWKAVLSPCRQYYSQASSHWSGPKGAGIAALHCVFNSLLPTSDLGSALSVRTT
jgi:hypothetical protein